MKIGFSPSLPPLSLLQPSSKRPIQSPNHIKGNTNLLAKKIHL